ncbi:sporulation protein YunB [Vulcanibacillus modesticaldus]|uniref:Sporulation protein YunB n=1 Tax=Vulcanibacillus modesticaldus TaxID=337097 RepID=A0A1D2YUL3_9BACI|nr:sporulation protein YunB [Vulcanibacillus modesticaldus]OEF99389.1 sporulation protein YunB [Vulcanibacillus modesticaldus]
MPRWGRRTVRFQKKRLVIMSLLLLMLIIFQSFLYIEKQLEPILMSIAQARVKQIATNAVNDAITKKIAQNTNFKDLIQFEMDNNGKIRAAIFNYSEFARIVGEATAKVENTLNELEKMVEPIKLGAVFNSELLADFGPELPITIIPIGSVQVNPKTIYHNAGINVVVMTVLMEIRAEVQVVIPFVTEPSVITSAIPIAQTQIFGDVPQFYYGGNYYNQTPELQTAPPIQIIPGTPVVPNDGQINPTQDSIPSTYDYIEPIFPGIEIFMDGYINNNLR